MPCYPEGVTAMNDATNAPALCTRFHHASELIGRRWTGAIIFMLLQADLPVRDAARRHSRHHRSDAERAPAGARRGRPGRAHRGAGDAGARRILADQEGQGARRARSARSRTGRRNTSRCPDAKPKARQRAYRTLIAMHFEYVSRVVALLLLRPRQRRWRSRARRRVAVSARPVGHARISIRRPHAQPIPTAACRSTPSISRPARVAALTPAATGTTSSRAGRRMGSRIAFKSNRGGSYNLYVMDADGRNVVRLTDHARQRSRSDMAARRREPGVQLRSRSRRAAAAICIGCGWPTARRAIDHVLPGLCVHAERVAGRRWVAFVAQTFPVDGGWANQVHVLEIATRQTWPFDIDGAGCWPNWSPDGQSIAHVSLLDEPSNIQTRQFVRRAPQPMPGEAGAVALLSRLVARQPPARRLGQPRTSRRRGLGSRDRRSDARDARCGA